MHRSHLALVAAALLLPSLGAAAAAQRTFVSTTGNDANTVANCSLASPCRSFASALTVTGTGGEIIVLDSGGYGQVTIDKSVSIIAPDGVYAGITVPAGADGVDVAGADIVVVLRGLTINGQGGNVGISFLQGRALHIDRCTVSNVIGRGISLTTGNEFPAAVYITDTKVGEGGTHLFGAAGIYAEGNVDVSMDRTHVNGFLSSGVLVRNGPRVAIANSAFAGAGTGGAGIQIFSDDGASTTMATIRNSTLRDASFGVAVGTEGAGSTVIIAVTNVTLSNYASYGVALFGEDGGNQIAVISDSTMIGNPNQVAGDGILALGAGVSATISANTISGNTQAGVAVIGGALVKTLKNNVIQDNATTIDGTLTTVAGD